MRVAAEIRNVGVVKYEEPVRDAARWRPPPARDGRTRDRVAQLLLERGAATAAQLGAELGLSPAAIRKHLDAMLADHLVETREVRNTAARPRRPAKAFVLTAAARESFPHFYDGIATAALRWIAEHGGPDAVSRFAADAGRAAGGAAARRGLRGRRRPDRPGRGARRGADRRGLRCQRDHDRVRRAAVPAPLPGGPRGRRVPPAVRRRDRGHLPAHRHPRAAPRHHRARRRGVHHAHPGPARRTTPNNHG